MMSHILVGVHSLVYLSPVNQEKYISGELGEAKTTDNDGAIIVQHLAPLIIP